MAKKATTDNAEQAPDKPAASEAAKADAKPEGKGKGKPREPRAKTSPEAPPAAPPTAVPSPEAPAAKAPAPGEPTKKKGRRPGVPPRRGKKLRNQMNQTQKNIAKEGPSPLKRAIALLKQAKRAKFDETVEIHMSLGIDATQSEQMIRGTVPLPNGIGKSVRVLVFCQGDNVAKAKAAGADFAGADDIIKKIQGEGWLDFDVALATQDMMGQVSRLGKVLGPRGLMPTPKAGTVITGDVAAAVKEFKAGKVEYRSDKGGNVHARVGKISFPDDKLEENVHTFIEQIKAVKPAGVKGHYIKSVTLSATMSPGIPVSV
jgi:large subunit ribosomal protein L1